MQNMHGILENLHEKARDEIRAHKINMLPIFRKNHFKTIASRSPDLGSLPSDTFPVYFSRTRPVVLCLRIPPYSDGIVPDLHRFPY